MYQGLKSLIIVNNKQCALFPCNIDIRQGKHLSPVLFSLYINHLEDYLSNQGCEGVSPMSNNQNQTLDIALHMFCLLFPYDTALLSSTAKNLQNTLNVLCQYSKNGNLK